MAFLLLLRVLMVLTGAVAFVAPGRQSSSRVTRLQGIYDWKYEGRDPTDDELKEMAAYVRRRKQGAPSETIVPKRTKMPDVLMWRNVDIVFDGDGNMERLFDKFYKRRARNVLEKLWEKQNFVNRQRDFSERVGTWLTSQWHNHGSYVDWERGRMISKSVQFLPVGKDDPLFVDPRDYRWLAWVFRLSARIKDVALREFDEANATPEFHEEEWYRGIRGHLVKTQIFRQRGGLWWWPSPDDALDSEVGYRPRKLKPLSSHKAKVPKDLDKHWSQVVISSGALREPGWGNRKAKFGSWFPETVSILRDYPACSPMPRHALIGRLPPGQETRPRVDFWNHVLTVQIPLKGCDGLSSGIQVGQDVRPWIVGEPVVFDSTFMYRMFNDGDETAYVLHFDIWHPDVDFNERNDLWEWWVTWQDEEHHPSYVEWVDRRNAWIAHDDKLKKYEAWREKIKKVNPSWLDEHDNPKNPDDPNAPGPPGGGGPKRPGGGGGPKRGPGGGKPPSGSGPPGSGGRRGGPPGGGGAGGGGRPGGNGGGGRPGGGGGGGGRRGPRRKPPSSASGTAPF
eukprot:CAMPEP_0118905034 /NCGR_PEP_ID=MMETSP1166-20130328/9245_1 /TAXON_ID=1104430 /ORGANISM="Chrysoreinhardia sp, Strain CCMP3193" /LENGTH=563 /DNA_ID=CAMNT_0006844303 /DNA_START=52 /DNA_END=1743 /DNA_ORIENTATION=-